MAWSRTNRSRRSSRSHGRRARAGNGKGPALKYAAALIMMAGSIGTGAYAFHEFANIERLSETYCFARSDQAKTLIFVDSSFTVALGASQRRDFATAFERVRSAAQPNTRIEVFTTTKGEDGSLAEPVFSICKPAENAAELAAIGAPSQTKARLRVIAEEAREAFRSGVERVMATASDPGRAASFSPVLETLASISRYPSFGGGDQLVVLSDGIQNSGLAQFCTVQGDMPRYASFAEREAFDSVRPRPLKDVRVRMFLVEHGMLPNQVYPFCSNDELRRWYGDYFTANGAAEVEITPIRFWGDE